MKRLTVRWRLFYDVGMETLARPTLEQFEFLTRSRRAIRKFKSDPIPEGLLERILDVARWAPSGYNLQPTHFVVVTEPTLKQALYPACMSQKQVIEAPATVVFTGDRQVLQNNLERMMEAERAAGATNAEHERLMRHYIGLSFSQGPFGLGWLWKATLAPLVSLVKPVPSIPAVHKRYWLAKQVLLAAMVFMLAAEAAGLATVPMEGFDERRVRRVLSIPRSHIVPLVVPVGYAVDMPLKKSRLPLENMVHYNGW